MRPFKIPPSTYIQFKIIVHLIDTTVKIKCKLQLWLAPPCATKGGPSIYSLELILYQSNKMWLLWLRERENTSIHWWYDTWVMSQFIFSATTHLVSGPMASVPWFSSWWLSQVLSLCEGDAWSWGYRLMSLTFSQWWEGVDCPLKIVSWSHLSTLTVEILEISEKIWSTESYFQEIHTILKASLAW